MANHDAIDTASPQDLKAVLRAVCEASSKQHDWVHNLLASIQKQREKATVMDSKDTKKRKADTEPAVCETCGETFLAEDDAETCCYHPGEPKPDEEHEGWNEFDETPWPEEAVSGDTEYDEMFEDYPERFIWDCCKRVGTAKGCEQSRHSAKQHEKAAATGSKDSKKRKADSEVAVCKACKQTFFVEDNAKTCLYHPGVMKPDHDGDFWADHDEECHGDIDSKELRKEYPEGYIWKCCQRRGTDEGCKRGRHSAKERRAEDFDSDEDAEESGHGHEDGSSDD